MLQRLEPVFRADLAHFMEVMEGVAPTGAVHPPLVWLARSPSDGTPLGAYLHHRYQRPLRALVAPSGRRLVVLSDTLPSTFDALSELRARSHCEPEVPLRLVFPAHAAELQGVFVDRVVPCQLFDATDVQRMRAQYGADLSRGATGALPNNEWHVSLVRGRAFATRWVAVIAHMDPRCFWSEVVERDMLLVGGYAELGFTFAETWHLADLIATGVVSAMYGRPGRTSVQGAGRGA